MTFGVNLFGGIMRWLAAPDQKIITAGEGDFFWRMRPTVEGFRSVAKDIVAEVSFVNAKYQRKTVFLTKLEGSLAEP